MIVNQQALHGIYTGFNTLFMKAFQEVTPLYDKVATIVPSTTGEESYKWLGAIPSMREWLGDRVVNSLTASDYTIKNKDFELTIGIPRNDIEDDKLGLYAPSIKDLSQSAALHPDDLVFSLLKKGFTIKCYDGKPFFSTDHPVGKKGISNVGTAALSPESYAAARSAIMSVTNDAGKSLKIVPDLLVVPPALESMARKILLADQIDGTTNTLKDTATPLVVPDLAGADTAWYLLCTTRPVKPLIFQKRQEPKFIALTSAADPNVFMKKEFLYGCDSRGNSGFGLWQMAYGSTGAGA